MTQKGMLTVGVAALAVVAGLFLSRGPWIAYKHEKQKADAATKSMKKTESETTDLMLKKAHLESPMGREELARQRGYTKPGEKPVDAGL